MLSNDIKEGMELKLTHGRTGVMKDNKRGITRVIEVPVSSQGFDIGSTYVDEFTHVKVDDEWEEVELTPGHSKQLNQLRSMGW